MRVVVKDTLASVNRFSIGCQGFPMPIGVELDKNLDHCLVPDMLVHSMCIAVDIS